MQSSRHQGSGKRWDSSNHSRLLNEQFYALVAEMRTGVSPLQWVLLREQPLRASIVLQLHLLWCFLRNKSINQTWQCEPPIEHRLQCTMYEGISESCLTCCVAFHMYPGQNTREKRCEGVCFKNWKNFEVFIHVPNLVLDEMVEVVVCLLVGLPKLHVHMVLHYLFLFPDPKTIQQLMKSILFKNKHSNYVIDLGHFLYIIEIFSKLPSLNSLDIASWLGFKALGSPHCTRTYLVVRSQYLKIHTSRCWEWRQSPAYGKEASWWDSDWNPEKTRTVLRQIDHLLTSWRYERNVDFLLF